MWQYHVPVVSEQAAPPVRGALTVHREMLKGTSVPTCTKKVDMNFSVLRHFPYSSLLGLISTDPPFNASGTSTNR